MSRSNNTELINPAIRFYEWNGDKGGFRYFDKALGEKGERVEVPLPFKFLVLDTLSTIKGFDDVDKSGYWCNEVRDLKKDIMTVRNKNGICAKGLYEQVSKDRNTVGSKYCQSVYIAFKEGKTLIIANIQMMGAALGSWIEFRKKNKIFDGAISVETMIEGIKGKTVYQIPVFKKIETSPETDQQAKELDTELQTYLGLYFKRNSEQVAEIHSIEAAEKEEVWEHGRSVDENIPFPDEENICDATESDIF